MCGIICYLGNKCCFNILVEGISNLLNRGYDSAGIFSVGLNNGNLSKFVSTELPAIEKIRNSTSHIGDNIGLAHTRWATHGEVSPSNAHPHYDMSEKIFIVHNGIIENYEQLKIMLIDNGYKFYSQTDSEVIANLISFYLKSTNNIEGAIEKCIVELVGTYAIGLIYLDNPNTLYTFKKGSPLLIGHNEKEVIVTSEQSGFGLNMDKYKIHPDDILVKYQIENDKLTCDFIEGEYINIVNNKPSKGIYKYWMEKEIYEQDIVINNFLKDKIIDGKLFIGENLKIISEYNNIILTGCGTSKHACEMGKFYFKDLSGDTFVQVIDGSDFELTDIPKHGKTAIILVSQSGETRDLYRCMELVKGKKDILTIGLINVENSLIAREVDIYVYLKAGKEVAVASTKVFLSASVALCYIALCKSYLTNGLTEMIVSYIDSLKLLPEQISKILKTKIDNNFIKLCNGSTNSMFILGKRQGEVIAKEGSLKIKEISYIHAEAYSAHSLKHGPFGLLERSFPVILIDVDNNYRNKINNVKKEIESREATVLLISDVNGDITIPTLNHFTPLLAVIPLQIVSIKLSISKGINPDYPRNLAKVVTVE